MRAIGFAAVAAWSLIFAGSGGAQSKIAFTQKAICREDGTVDIGKFLSVAIKDTGIDISKAFVNGTRIDNEKLHDMVVDTDPVITFQEEYLNKPNPYFRVDRGGPNVSVRDILRRPSAYTIRCSPQQETAARSLRRSVDEASKALGKTLIVGRDVDALSKPLATRNAAKFSVTKDSITKNTLLQADFAVATYFQYQVPFPAPNGEVDYASLTLFPFVAGSASFNSNDKLRDVDKLTAGLAMDFWSIPLLGTYHGISARAGWQSDTSKTYEASVFEFIYYPPAAILGVIPLRKTMPLAGPDGPWIVVDATPRIRYGEIYENEGIATLPPSGEFLRVGYKLSATFGFGGDDFLSKLGGSLSYLFFENIRGNGGISDFDKIDATLSYAITESIGVSLSYTRGRDEDQLKLVDQIVAALTFKFGEAPGSK